MEDINHLAMKKVLDFKRFAVFFLVYLYITKPMSAQIQWAPTNGPFSGEVQTMAVHPVSGNCLVLTDRYLFRMDKQEGVWRRLPLTVYSYFFTKMVQAAPGEIYFSQDKYVYRSPDFGDTWEIDTLPLTIGDYILATNVGQDGEVLITTQSNKCFFTSDHGNQWNMLNSNTGFSILSLIYLPSESVFMAGTTQGVWKSTDDGTTWTPANQGDLTNLTQVKDLIRLESSGTVLASSYNEIFRSQDAGITWSKIPGFYFWGNFSEGSSGKVYKAGIGSGLYYSLDDGITWSTVQGNGLEKIESVYAGLDSDVFVFGEDNLGLLKSTNPGVALWEIVGVPEYPAKDIFVHSATNTALVATDDTLFSSTNLGQFWSRANIGLDHPFFSGFSALGTQTFAWNTFSGVYQSMNQGQTWAKTSVDIPGTFIHDLESNNNNRLFLATSGLGDQVVFMSPNAGSVWGGFSQGLPMNANASSLAMAMPSGSPSYLFATAVFGVYRTEISGFTANWSNFSNGLPSGIYAEVYSSLDGQAVFATKQDGLYRSSSITNNWAKLQFPLAGLPVLDVLALDANRILAATDKGVYVSTNGGANWQLSNLGLLDLKITCLKYDGTNWWAGTETGGVHIGAGVLTNSDQPIKSTEIPLLWPNPASHEIVIEGNFEPEQVWEAYNNIGVVVQLTPVWRESSIRLNIASLAPGIWYIKTQGIRALKVIRQ